MLETSTCLTVKMVRTYNENRSHGGRQEIKQLLLKEQDIITSEHKPPA